MYKDLNKVGIYSGPWNGWRGKDAKLLWRFKYWFSPISILRRIRYWCQRRIYGIDSRWCYSLDSSIQMMLYVALKRYLKDAENVIDLEFYKIDFRGNTYTQKELIEKAFVCFEKAFDCEKEIRRRAMSRKQRKEFDRLEDEKWKNAYESEPPFRMKSWAIEEFDKKEREEQEASDEFMDIIVVLMSYLSW